MMRSPFGSAAKRRGAPFAWAALFATVLALAATLPSSASDAWYETLLAGARVGVVREDVAVESDTLLVTTVESRLAVERFSERTEMERLDKWVETTDGRPVSYESTLRMAGDDMSLVVRALRGGLALARRSGARVDTSFMPTQGAVLFPRGVDQLHAARRFRPGDTYSYLTFDPDFEAVCECSVVVTGAETLTLAGETRALNVIEITPSLYGGIVLREWRDDTGRLWAQDAPGLATATRRATAGEALAKIAPPDIVSSTLVRSNVVIVDPESVDEALYEIWLDGGDVTPFVETPPGQVVEGRTGRGVLLRVRRLVPGSSVAGSGESTSPGHPSPASPGHAEPAAPRHPEPVSPVYLEDSAMLQKDDPDVVRAAERAVGGAGPGAWDRSVRIEAAVHRLVSDRGFGTGFASAAEVLRTGSGDCSEHAVLAAAMGRAVGIPSRVVTGVVHFRGGFAYHMWVEVLVEGGWYAIDPTQGRGSVDATHVRLGASALPGGSIGELALPILGTANRLGIRVVEYTTAGVTTIVDGH